MPSEKILTQKKETVLKLSEKLKESYFGVLVDYKGINVADDTNMRKEFREADVDYFVVKNSILRFACKDAGIALDEYLTGSTALALSKEDPTAGPKIIYKYAKQMADKNIFKVKAGFMGGEILDEPKIKELGTLPSREQLIAQLLSLFVSPVRSLAISLNEIAKKCEEAGVDSVKDLSAENKAKKTKSESDENAAAETVDENKKEATQNADPKPEKIEKSTQKGDNTDATAKPAASKAEAKPDSSQTTESNAQPETKNN